MSEIATEEKPDLALVSSVFDRVLGKDESTPAIVSTHAPVIAKEEVKTEVIPETNPVEKITPQPSEEPPESLPNEGRSEKWKDLRSRYKIEKEKAQTLETQLAEFEGTRKERDELKTRITEQESKLEKLTQIDSLARWQNDPDVQAKYDSPRNSTVDELKKLAQWSDIDPSELLGVLNLSDKDKVLALERIVESAPSVVKGKIIAAVDKIEQIDRDRAAEMQDVRASLDKRNEERQRAAKERRESLDREAQEIFTKTSTTLAKELGVDAATIDKAREVFLKNQDLGLAAQLIIKGMAAEGALGKGAEKDKRIKELEDELAKYRESSPNLSGGSGNAPIASDKSFIQSIKEGAHSARVI